MSSIVRAASPHPPPNHHFQTARPHKSAPGADAFIGLWAEACHPYTACITRTNTSTHFP